MHHSTLVWIKFHLVKQLSKGTCCLSTVTCAAKSRGPPTGSPQTNPQYSNTNPSQYFTDPVPAQYFGCHSSFGIPVLAGCFAVGTVFFPILWENSPMLRRTDWRGGRSAGTRKSKDQGSSLPRNYGTTRSEAPCASRTKARKNISPSRRQHKHRK